jgi:hypothetical protein
VCARLVDAKWGLMCWKGLCLFVVDYSARVAGAIGCVCLCVWMCRLAPSVRSALRPAAPPRAAIVVARRVDEYPRQWGMLCWKGLYLFLLTDVRVVQVLLVMCVCVFGCAAECRGLAAPRDMRPPPEMRLLRSVSLTNTPGCFITLFLVSVVGTLGLVRVCVCVCVEVHLACPM